MKRKLISFLMLLFVTVFLSGCDLFGPGTTTTTEGTDTGTYHTVVFFDGDGTSILKTEQVLDGEAATAPATATKASTAQYSYVFTGWDKDFSNVTSDLLVYPTFNQAVNQYTVTFYDDDGTTVLGTDTVTYGTAATAPEDPTKEDDETYTYEFAGWDVAFNNITGNLTVTATYTAILLESFTVTFENWDGTVLDTQQVQEGEDATAPANPTRPQTAQYTFTFAGWDGDYTNVTEDVTITATYTQTVRNYTVTFENWDGTVLVTRTVAYGSAATAPANPTRPATAQYTYAFTGWDVAFNNITGNLTVTAQYSETLNSYTVTFEDEDGTVLDTQTVNYGSPATAPTDPTKDGTAQYTYTFAGWDVAFDNITGDLTVTATYTETVNTYTVTFEDEDGTVLDTQTIAYGSAATAPTDPVKPDTAMYTYVFAGWDAAFDNITGDLTVTATYTETIRSFTVVFEDEDGTVLDTQTIEYGNDATAPANPYKAPDASNAYEFAGWDVDFTNVTTALTVTATYNAVPLDTEYVVNFYDAYGNIIDTQNVVIGSDATAPMTNPGKGPDQQYTYTFAGWDTDFTNVNTNLDVYPVYNTVLNQYTVTFYDWDDTVLGTETVNYGEAATAPANPTRPDDASWSYTFIGWDVPYGNVHMELHVHAIYFKTSLLAFDHQQLVDLVNDMFGYPDDVEDEILDLLVVFEAADEETLYNELMMVQQLMFEMQFINSAESMQNWYARTKTMGFDEDKLVSILYHAMTLGMSNDLNWIQQDIDYYLGIIADAEANILAAEALMPVLYQNAMDYCATTVYATLCAQYVDIIITQSVTNSAYFNALYGNTPEMFDYNVYYDLEWYTQQMFYYTNEWPDTDEVIFYQGLFDGIWDNLTLEEQTMYQSMLDLYDDYLWADYDYWYSDFGDLDNYDPVVDNSVRGHVDTFLYGSYDEFDNYIEGYLDQLDNINHYEWIIVETTWWLEDAYDELEMTQAMVNVLTDPQGSQDVMNLMHSVYDMLDAVMLTMDQEMFDFAFDMMDKLMGGVNPVFSRGMERVNPLELILTPENIEFLAGKLYTMLVAAADTMDESDYANIQAVVIDLLDEILTLQGMDPVDEATFIASITARMTDYFMYIEFLGDQVLSFLASMDTFKAEAIISFIGSDFYMEGGEVDLIIKFTKLGTLVIGDGSIDIPTLFEYMTAIYFDVTTGFNADPTTVANTQTSVVDFINDTLLLADEIKDYNPTFVSPANVETIFEFIARIKAIGSWLEMGFEHVDDPLIVYQEYYLPSFIHMVLGEWNVTEVIPIYLDIMGLTLEDDLFYSMTSIFQYMTGIMRVRDFAGIQEWVNGMETFGFTQSELIDYFVKMLAHKMDEAALGDYDFQMQLQDIEDTITQYQNLVSQWEAYMQDVDNVIQGEINTLDPSLQQTALDYWEATKASYMYMSPYYNWYWELENYLGSSNALAMESALIDMYYYEVGTTEYDAAEAAYLAIYNTLDEYQQYVVDEFEAILALYKPATWLANETYTLLDASGFAAGLINEVDDQISVYMNHYNNWIFDYEDLMYWLERKDEFMQQLAMPIFMSEFLGDLANQLMVEESMGILMDDFQNMIASMPSDSFAMLPKLIEMIEQSMKRPDIYFMEEEIDHGPFEIPFSAEDIHGMLTDLSTFLKLRGDTITPEETTSLEAMILTVITAYVDTLEMDPVDAAAFVTMINDFVMKYADYLDIALTELTDMLDGLTVTDVEMFLDVFNMMQNNQLTGFQAVIMISQLISSIMDAPDFDIYIVLDMYLELYMDINNGPENWDPTDLTALQDGWALFISDLLDMIDTAALSDPFMPVDPLEYPTLYEIQQRVEYLRYLFEYPEEILNPAYFGYSHDDFEDLCYNLFRDVDWSNVDQRITDLTLVFEMTEEETFYFMLGLANTAYGLQNIQTIEDVRALFNSLGAMGLDNETIAHYVMNAVMIFLYPNLLDMADTSYIEDQITYFSGAQAAEQGNFDFYQSQVFAEINAIADEATRNALYDLWQAYVDYQSASALYEYIYDTTYWEEFFNWWTYDQLISYLEMDDWDSIYWILDGMDGYAYWRYMDLLYLYQDVNYYEQVYGDKLFNFDSMYPDLALTTNAFYYFVDYFEDQFGWVYNGYYMIHQYGQILMNYEMELENIQDSAVIYNMLYEYLSDPINVALAEDVLVIMLDEFEALLMNPDIIVLPEIINLLPDGKFVEMDPNELAMKLNRLGSLLNSMFSTIDGADVLVLENFGQIVSGIIAEHMTDLTDPLDIDAQVAAIQLILATYGQNILDIPGLIGDFLIAVDGNKVENAINELIYMTNVDTGDETLDNIIRLTSIANLLETLVGDDSLNYALLVDAVLPFAYEMVSEIGYTPITDDSAVVVLTTLAKIDLVLAQAEVVALIDPYNLQPGDLDALDTMKTLIDDLGAYLDQIFNAEPPL